VLRFTAGAGADGRHDGDAVDALMNAGGLWAFQVTFNAHNFFKSINTTKMAEDSISTIEIEFVPDDLSISEATLDKLIAEIDNDITVEEPGYEPLVEE
jgi:hypothetical protein